MRIKHGLLAAIVALVVWPAISIATAENPPTASAALATCDDYDNQAQAQRAKDARDADGDDIYCETLRCPCLAPDPRAGGGGGDDPSRDEDKPDPARAASNRAACSGSCSTGMSSLRR
jgi:hypothetical protein